jgi:hypothetical protein
MGTGLVACSLLTTKAGIGMSGRLPPGIPIADLSPDDGPGEQQLFVDSSLPS